jgi:hypothetical protein
MKTSKNLTEIIAQYAPQEVHYYNDSGYRAEGAHRHSQHGVGPSDGRDALLPLSKLGGGARRCAQV